MSMTTYSICNFGAHLLLNASTYASVKTSPRNTIYNLVVLRAQRSCHFDGLFRYQLAVVPSLIASAAVFHFYQLIEACLLAIAMLGYYLLLSKCAV